VEQLLLCTFSKAFENQTRVCIEGEGFELGLSFRVRV